MEEAWQLHFKQTSHFLQHLCCSTQLQSKDARWDMRASKPDDYKPKLLGSEQKPETSTYTQRQTGRHNHICFYLLDRMEAQGMLKNLTLYSPPTPSFLITWRVTSIALPCPSWMRTCASIYPLNYMSFAPQFLLNSPLHMIIGLSLHQCLKQERRIQQVEGLGENRRDHESDHR